MENKIFLLKNKSKFSTNDRNFIGVNLENNARLAISTDLSETISLYDLYNEERDNCEKFRLIFNVNPICSNVLFNNVSEIVRNEGSSACTVIDLTGVSLSGYVNQKSTVDRIQAIRDTEYSKDYDYHCGYDIFNNHILRANNFPFIGPVTASTTSDDNDLLFNTFSDLARDNNGCNIEMPSYSSTGETMIKMHVYNTDTLDAMATAFADKCEEKEGWFGFYNKTLIDIKNASTTTHGTPNYIINRVICNQAPCSFIDMYPDRSLYSFSPKYNSYRKRAEKNWDYCITYPYENDVETFNLINGNDVNAVKVYSHELGTTSTGVQVIRMKSLFKHNLKKGDYVNIYVSEKKSDTNPTLMKKILVRSIGDAEKNDTDKIFNIYFDDVRTKCKIEDGRVKSKSGNNVYFYFKKNVNGSESEYYFRKFKKIYTDEISGITPHSEINKLSFARNVFGDNITQILYTDDVDISGLVDNLGRPLSSIYLTVVKRNKGHELWYSAAPIYNSSEIEYSHCFGDVTSGLDLPSDYYDYNIHKLHNIDLSNLDNMVRLHTGEMIATYNIKNSAEDYQATLDELLSYHNSISNMLVQTSIKSSSVPLKVSSSKATDKSTTSLTRNNATILGGTTGVNASWAETMRSIDLSSVNVSERNTFKVSSEITPTKVQISYNDGTKNVFSNFTTKPKTLESAITIDSYDEFLGDMTEFNKSTYMETTIDYVYHRFNTAQREFTASDEYADVLEDNIIFDDYFNYGSFMSATTAINLADKVGSTAQTLYLGNLNPEGYFYNPHYKIKLKETSDTLSSLLGYNISYDGDEFMTSGITVEAKEIEGVIVNYEYKIPYSEDYEMKAGNYFAFYNLNTDTIYWGVVREVFDDYITVDCSDKIPDDDFRTNLIFLYYINGVCPTYARFIFSQDKFVWRETISPSRLTNSSDLFDTPFSNGAFYVEKNINFFLRRQDPHGDYYMSNPEENPKRPGAFASEARKYKKFSLGKFTFEGIKNLEDLFNSSCE